MATKQELIDFYQMEYEKHIEASEGHRKILMETVDEENIFYHDQFRKETAIIASLCSQFVKNLKELEG